MDIANISIDQSKISADGDAYFALFDKHIPRNLGNESTVLLYELANMTCIMKIIALNPDAKYIVIGNEFVNDALKLMVDKHIDVEYKEEIDLKECDMKFDCIVMNPPYQRNLHLKILAEAIKHLKDDESVCVNLSPDNWITNPFKMFEKEKLKREAPIKIGKYVVSHESISQEDFNNLFGTSNYFGVGIVTVGTKETGFDCSEWNSTNELLLKILEKIYKMPSLRSKFSRRVNNTKFVPVRRRTHKTYNYCEMDSNDIDAKDGILFDTEVEAMNFKKSIIDTWLYKWLDTTEWEGSENSAEVPWLGDAVNPRTGLKGYQSEWTDDDLVLYFDITPEEYNIIKKTMEKYK